MLINVVIILININNRISDNNASGPRLNSPCKTHPLPDGVGTSVVITHVLVLVFWCLQ